MAGSPPAAFCGSAARLQHTAAFQKHEPALLQPAPLRLTLRDLATLDSDRTTSLIAPSTTLGSATGHPGFFMAPWHLGDN